MTWLRGDDRAVTTAQGSEPEEHAGSPAGGDPPEPQPQPMALWRKVAVAVVLVALVVGIGWQLKASNDRDGQLVTPTSSTATIAESPTSIPATVDPSKPPELRNTGEDFDSIVRSVNDFEDWVYQYDPDPKWVPFFIDPRNTDEYGYEAAKKGLADLQAAGQNFSSQPLRIRKVIVRERVSDDHVGIYVVYEGVPGGVVDSAGKVVKEWPVLPPTGYFEDWMRAEDGRWRPVHSVVLGPPAPEVLG